MKRLLNTSSITGSAVGTPAFADSRGGERSSTRCSWRSPRAPHPGSTTVVALCSAMIAGPSMRCTGRELREGTRRRRATLLRCAGARSRAARLASSPGASRSWPPGSLRPSADRLDRERLDDDTASGMRNAKRARYAALERARASWLRRGPARPAPCRSPRTSGAHAGARSTRSAGTCQLAPRATRLLAEPVELTLPSSSSAAGSSAALERLLAHRA